MITEGTTHRSPVFDRISACHWRPIGVHEGGAGHQRVYGGDGGVSRLGAYSAFAQLPRLRSVSKLAGMLAAYGRSLESPPSNSLIVNSTLKAAILIKLRLSNSGGAEGAVGKLMRLWVNCQRGVPRSTRRLPGLSCRSERGV